MDQELADAFHESWYHEHRAPWHTRWRGLELTKNPLDLWVYGEIIHETKPDLIIECGTFKGGSAHYMADMMRLMNGKGRVVTIDILPIETPKHEHITYMVGDSATIKLPRFDEERIMVVLDSNHSKPHVLRELDRYGPLVTPGCYMIVEDSNVGGNPIESDYATGGPHAAIEEWVPRNPEFIVDKAREKYVLTMNPDGWLLKT